MPRIRCRRMASFPGQRNEGALRIRLLRHDDRRRRGSGRRRHRSRRGGDEPRHLQRDRQRQPGQFVGAKDRTEIAGQRRRTGLGRSGLRHRLDQAGLLEHAHLGPADAVHHLQPLPDRLRRVEDQQQIARRTRQRVVPVTQHLSAAHRLGVVLGHGPCLTAAATLHARCSSQGLRSRSSRRSTLPTGVLGSSSRNSTMRGRL